MKTIISNEKQIVLDPCKYQLNFTFTAFDVSTGEQLHIDNMLIDGVPIDDNNISCKEVDVEGEGTKYYYTVNGYGTKKFKLTIEKTKYYPSTNEFIVNLDSIYDDAEVFDLGEIPMLKEIKTNAIVLTWGKLPSDLDAYITNPDGSETSAFNRKTYYSIVDIDDTTGFGPETISIHKWVDFDTKYKIGGTFKYRVNWYEKNNNTTDTELGASVYLFLDAEQPREFIVREELEGKNRRGQDWVVFDIDMKSILGKYEINRNNLITVDVEVTPKGLFADNKGETLTKRLDHLNRIFNNFDFIYSLYDEDENEIQNSEYTITKDLDKKIYVCSGKAAEESNKIKFFINQKFKDENLPYIELQGCSSITCSNLFAGKLIPFIMYDKSGDKIKEVKYRYSKDSKNEIFIDILNKMHDINNVSKFSYILGVDDTHNYSEFKDPDENTPNDLSQYDSFLYQDTEEINNIKFKYNDSTKKLNIIGNIFYNNYDYNYEIYDGDKFDINILPYTKNVKWVDINRNDSNIIFTKYNISNVTINTSQKIASLRRDGLQIDNSNDYADLNYILSKVTKKEVVNGRTVKSELNFTYEWLNGRLKISFDEELTNATCDLEFTTIYSYISRDKFDLPKVKNERPSIYIHKKNEDGTYSEISATYYYVWDVDGVGIYFMEDPQISSNSYKIKSIHYLKIYQLNVCDLNYYQKNMSINVEVLNYDDPLWPVPESRYIWWEENGEYFEEHLPGQKNPIYWVNLNLYKYSQKHSRYILTASNTKSSKYGYQTTENMSYYDNGNHNVYLKTNLTKIQGSSSQFVDPYSEDWENPLRTTYLYRTNITTKFKKNNFIKSITLYNDIELEDTDRRQTNINDDNDQVLTYKVQYPYVNFYGNFYDNLNNCYPNETIKSMVSSKSDMDSYEGSEQRFYPKIAYKVELVNTNPSLSADLNYKFEAPYLNKAYGYNFRYQWGQTPPPSYNFMFKHSSFDPGDGYSYESPCNQYIESIYPGTYKSKLSLYKIDVEASKATNQYDPAKYLPDAEEYDMGILELTKENEATSGLYNYKYQLPLISVSGCVKNSADGSLVYGQGLTVEFINKTDPQKSRKFIYDCYFGGDECRSDWQESNHNRLNQTFLFKLFGLDRKYDPYSKWEAMDGYYSNWSSNYFSTDPDQKHHEMGLSEGTYHFKVYYKDIIFYEDKNFEVSKDDENLMNIEIESPLIDISGYIIDSNGLRVGGENWSVYVEDSSKNIIRQYRYGYTLNPENMYYLKEDDSFSFKNLPLSTFFDLRNYQFSIDNGFLGDPEKAVSEFTKEREGRWALPSGSYKFHVFYKTDEVGVFNYTLNKKDEEDGKYREIILNVGDLFKDLNLVFIDGQFNSEIICKNRNGSPGYRIDDLTIHDENFDGDITNDNFNGTSWTINDAGPSAKFENLKPGYYKFQFKCESNNVYPKILDIVDSKELEESGLKDLTVSGALSGLTTSVYERKEETGAKFDLLNIGDDNVQTSATLAVIVPHWYCEVYYKLNNIDYLNGAYVTTTFEHQNLDYSFSFNGQSKTYSSVPTGKYKIISKLHFPDPNDGTLNIIAAKTKTIKESQNISYDSILTTRSISFYVIGKMNDGSGNMRKIPHNPSFSCIRFSKSLSGTMGTYHNSSSNKSPNNDNILSYDNLLPNIYYAFDNTGTDGTSYATNYDIYLKKYNSSDFINGLINESAFEEAEILDKNDNNKFNISDLESGSTYYLVLDKYVVKRQIQICNSKGDNSSLNYNVFVYNDAEETNLIYQSLTSSGYCDIGNVWSGTYYVKVCYRGMDVTPLLIKGAAQKWYDDGKLYINLNQSLPSVSGILLYQGNNTILSSKCELAVNVNLLTHANEMIWDETKENELYDEVNYLQYYSPHEYSTSTYYNEEIGIGNSKIDGPWATSWNDMIFKELFAGVYKVDIVYQNFNYTSDVYMFGGLMKTINSSNWKGESSLPIKISKNEILNQSLTISSIENICLSNVYEQFEAYDTDKQTWIRRTKFSTMNYILDAESDPDYFIIKKSDNFSTLYDSFNKSCYTSKKATLYITFGDLLSSFYMLVTDDGGKIISGFNDVNQIDDIKDNLISSEIYAFNDSVIFYDDEIEEPKWIDIYDERQKLIINDDDTEEEKIEKKELLNELNTKYNKKLSNYNTSTKLKEVVLPYVYIKDYKISTSGYETKHGSTNLEMYINNELNFDYDFYNNYGTLSKEMTNSLKGYPKSYPIRSCSNCAFRYMRGDYELASGSLLIDRNGQSINLHTDKVGSISGTIINKSINEPVKHSITYSVYLESDEGNAGFENDTTSYMNGTISSSSRGKYYFDCLFLDDRAKINLAQADPTIVYDSVIEKISGNIIKNIEIPYETFNINISYKSNKTQETASIPEGALTLIRKTNDGYDETYKINSNQLIKSGIYSSIIFEDADRSVRYEYNDIVVTNNRSFVFRFYCEISEVTIDLGGANYMVKIYDECGNLYLSKEPNSNGIVGPIILMNVTYTFTRCSSNGVPFENQSKTIKLENTEESVDLSNF